MAQAAHASVSSATITHIKGIALAPQVRRRFYGSYQVESQSEPGVWHSIIDLDVFRSGHGMVCSCRGFFYRHDCVHVHAVQVARELARKGHGPRQPRRAA